MKLRSLILCALFAALTAAGSFLRIPIPGTMLVFTLQTFFVFLSGFLQEPKYAMLSQVVYIAVGLLGLPIFSAGGGVSYVLTPSFGFLIGFIACAGLLSTLARKGLASPAAEKEHRLRRFARIGACGLAAIIAMYIIGIAYMYVILNFYLGNPKTLGEVALAGTGVFVFIDIAKLAVALPLAAAVIRRLPMASSGSPKKHRNDG